MKGVSWTSFPQWGIPTLLLLAYVPLALSDDLSGSVVLLTVCTAAAIVLVGLAWRLAGSGRAGCPPAVILGFAALLRTLFLAQEPGLAFRTLRSLTGSGDGTRGILLVLFVVTVFFIYRRCSRSTGEGSR